jgi:hypothetical protein
MADSLSTYLATEIIEWLANATDVDPAPGTLYVTVEDDTDTDRSGDFTNAPAGIGSANWTTSGTTFQNDTNVNLGESTADVNNIETIAIYDGSDPSTDNLLLETPITNGPFDVADGTVLIFETGDINYDAVEETV